MDIIGQFAGDVTASTPNAQSAKWVRAAWNALPALVRRRISLARGEAASKPQGESQRSPLEQVIGELRNLNQSTEADFLSIGEKLMEFLQSAEVISSGIGELAKLTSGEQGNHVAEALTVALDRCRKMTERTDERTAGLEALRVGAISVGSAFAGFGNTVSSFRVICTLTRIETARVAGQQNDLNVLLENAIILAETMGFQVDKVLDATTGLNLQIEQAVANLSGMEHVLKDISLVIPEAIRSMDIFSKQQADAASVYVSLASDSHAVAGSINDAVTSIQFHDITHQQVEHVIEALEHIREAGKAHGEDSSIGRATALNLEACQLANAEQAFTNSVARLSQDLESIATGVSRMTSSGRSLLGASGEGQDSFFREMEQCLTAILAAIVNHDGAETETVRTADFVRHTLSDMQSAAGQVREIDLKLHRVALNANLQACNLGDDGRTLTVLAAALQDLSQISTERSSVVGRELDSMSAALSRLAGRAENAESATSLPDENAVMHEIQSEIVQLHSWSEASLVRIREIAALTALLCDDISTARSGFTAGIVFAEAIARCQTVLGAMGARPVSVAGAEIEPDTHMLHDYARRYTMQAERDVHASIMGAEAFKPASTGDKTLSGITQAAAGEFGDNVELF